MNKARQTTILFSAISLLCVAGRCKHGTRDWMLSETDITAIEPVE